MNDFIYGGVLIVPLIVGLVELAKRAGLSAAYAPLLALGIGLLTRLGFQATAGEAISREWAEAVIQGLALGLSASGLYSGVKSLGAGSDA